MMWQNWILKLVAFGILSTVVLNLMPKENYRKYIRLTLGFLLILIIMEPVMRLFGQTERFQTLFSDIFSRVEVLEAQPEYKEAKEAYEELLKGLYEDQIKEMGEEPWITETDGTDSGQN